MITRPGLRRSPLAPAGSIENRRRMLKFREADSRENGMSEAAVMSVPRLVITDSAAARIARLAEQENNPETMLRITISGGGCSGFQYGFSLDSTASDDDRVFAHAGSRVVVDEVSFDLLGGAVIDFVEDLSGAAFQIRNPNASSSCGCGTSFAI